MTSPRVTRWTQLLGVVLVIAGFGLLGAMAMSRVAFAAVVNGLACPSTYVGDPQPCHTVLGQLNYYTKATGVAGVLTMLSGGLGIRYAGESTEVAADE